MWIGTKMNASVEVDILDDTSVSSTSGVSMAFTAKLTDKKKSHELEMCKLTVEWQKEKTGELTKERDYLMEQMESEYLYPVETEDCVEHLSQTDENQFMTPTITEDNREDHWSSLQPFQDVSYQPGLILSSDPPPPHPPHALFSLFYLL
ncbi:uncharacterized protein KZ484_009863 [Pholidichthys leucotaenia]